MVANSPEVANRGVNSKHVQRRANSQNLAKDGISTTHNDEASATIGPTLDQELEEHDDPESNSSVRPRPRPRPLKQRPREHGWQQPVPLEERDQTVRARRQISLSEVVFSLLCLGLCVHRTAVDANEQQDQSSFGWKDRDYIKSILPQELIREIVYYQGHHSEDQIIRQFIENLGMDDLVQHIQDLRMVPYLSRLLKQRRVLHNMASTRKKVVVASKDFTVPRAKIEVHGTEYRWSEYAEDCAKDYEATWVMLRVVYNIVLQLRDSIREAASNEFLDTISLARLEVILSSMQEEFDATCRNLSKPNESLLWNVKSTTNDLGNGQFHDSEPKNVATAYRKSTATNSTLAFVVPTVSLLACIPTFLAWTRSSPQAGRLSDANFYQTVASSVMQLLGIVTMIVPTAYNDRLVRMAWVWTWLLAGVSAVCAAVAIPLYLYVPTEWSALLSFVSSVAQAFVILQLVFTLDK